MPLSNSEAHRLVQTRERAPGERLLFLLDRIAVQDGEDPKVEIDRFENNLGLILGQPFFS
jgi:hypothetical protein